MPSLTISEVQYYEGVQARQGLLVDDALPLEFGKKRKRSRKRERAPESVQIEVSRPLEVPEKYWNQRFGLFSRFNEGIRLDTESWFSVTPELIAIHIAHRVAKYARQTLVEGVSTESEEKDSKMLVLDCFCGVGGNAIQMAQFPGLRVLAVDIDPEKVAMARHNAGIYGVADRVTFLVADSIALLAALGGLKNALVFLSPPWGGPGYLSLHETGFRLQDIQVRSSVRTNDNGDSICVNGADLLRLARAVTPNVVYFLPRNISTDHLALSDSNVEVEGNVVNNKLKTKTVYYGGIAKLEQTSKDDGEVEVGVQAKKEETS